MNLRSVLISTWKQTDFQTHFSDHRIPILCDDIADEAGKLIASKPAICTGESPVPTAYRLYMSI